MAAAAATLMRGLLYGIQPLDPAAFAISTGPAGLGVDWLLSAGAQSV